MKPVVAILLLMGLCGCVKKEVPVTIPAKPEPPVTPAPTAADVKISFAAYVGSEQLVFNDVTYKNKSGDEFTVSLLNYYISNVQLKAADGKVFDFGEYYLMKHADSVRSFSKLVEPGTYTKLRFLIGVDSIRNVSGAQTGALDPVHNMFWEWNSGYIFYKLEGTFSSRNSPVTDGFAIHVGGFSGPLNTLQWVELSLPAPLVVDGKKSKHIYLKTNVSEVFETPHTIGFDDYYPVTETIFRDLSQNYRDMFSVQKIEN